MDAEGKAELQLSDAELQKMVEDLSLHVREKEAEVQALKNEVDEITDKIQAQRESRSDFKMQLFTANEVSPLVKQCLQLRQNLARKQREFDAVIHGTPDKHRQTQKLRRKLTELDYGEDTREMEDCNKENLSKLGAAHEPEKREEAELNEELKQLQARVSELVAREDCLKKSTASTATGRRKRTDLKLDKFARNTCKD